MSQETAVKKSITDLEQNTIDLLRSVLMMNIGRALINDLSESNVQLPEGMNRNILKQTVEAMDRYAREIKRTVGKTGTYFDKYPNWEKVTDITTVAELVYRTGIEEGQSMYSEFQGILIDCIDTVFYSQKHRKNMYFAKYKALFNLIAEEIRCDANRQPGQIRFHDGELFFRSVPPIHEPKIEE